MTWYSRITMLLASSALIFSFDAVAQERKATEESGVHEAHWSYRGETGPTHWGDLTSGAPVCKTGLRQSPIDLVTDQASSPYKPFILDYKESSFEFINNGHSIQAAVKPGRYTLDYDGSLFTLRQFHFHAPSEHTVDGRSFPMELHLVHASESGSLAVVGVFIKEGERNSTLAEPFQSLPGNDKEKEKAKTRNYKVDIPALLPENRGAFEYIGSLTTPPCSENVNWIVLRQPITLSKEQIEAFKKLYPDNNRPVQKPNERLVGKN
jgi:carbonic anhydrase